MYQKLSVELFAMTCAVASINSVPVLSYRFPGPIRQLVGAETLRNTGSGVEVFVAVGGMVGDAVGVGTGSVTFASIAETVISTRTATVRSRSGVSAAAKSSA